MFFWLSKWYYSWPTSSSAMRKNDLGFLAVMVGGPKVVTGRNLPILKSFGHKIKLEQI